jgi:hypothetical protein
MLIAFGFAWMVIAALIGLFLGAKHENHIETLGSAAACGNFVEYHRIFEAYKWRSSVHAHGMLFSLTSVAVGLVLLQSGHGVPMPGALAGALTIATVVWTLAALRRIRPLMGLADLLFICAIATVAVCTAWST